MIKVLKPGLLTTVQDLGRPGYQHALALADIDGATYVVDSYRLLGRYFNGHRLADLLAPPADGRYPLAGPPAARNASDPGRWRLAPLAYPVVRRLD